MKKLLLLLVLLPLFASAQNTFDYKISDPYKVIDANQKYYFSDIEKGKIISIKIDKKMSIYKPLTLQH